MALRPNREDVRKTEGQITERYTQPLLCRFPEEVNIRTRDFYVKLSVTLSPGIYNQLIFMWLWSDRYGDRCDR